MELADKQQIAEVRHDFLTREELEWLKASEPDTIVFIVPECEAIVSSAFTTDRNAGLFGTIYEFLDWRVKVEGVDSVIDMLGYNNFGELVENVASMQEDSTIDDIIEAYNGAYIADYLEAVR